MACSTQSMGMVSGLKVSGGCEWQLLSRLQSRLEYWENCKRKEWKFLRGTTDIHPFRPPSLSGWIWTINGLEILWDEMKTAEAKFLHLRWVDQDPLENLFGLVRSMCGSCQNPTAVMFISAFKTSIINGLAYRDQKDTNCEPEVNPAPPLCSLRSYLSKCTQEEVPDFRIDYGDLKFCLYKIPPRLNVFEGAAVEFFSGYVARKILVKNACNTCKTALCSEDHTSHEFSLISAKEYFEDQRLLTYPSKNLLIVITSASTSFEEIIPTMSYYSHLSEKIMRIIKPKLDFSWLQNKCDIHSGELSDKILLTIIHVMLPWWCKQKN